MITSTSRSDHLRQTFSLFRYHPDEYKCKGMVIRVQTLKCNRIKAQMNKYSPEYKLTN